MRQFWIYISSVLLIYTYVYIYVCKYIYISVYQVLFYDFTSINSFNPVSLVLLTPVYTWENWGMEIKWLAHVTIASNLVLGFKHKSLVQSPSCTLLPLILSCKIFVSFSFWGRVLKSTNVTLFSLKKTFSLSALEQIKLYCYVCKGLVKFLCETLCPVFLKEETLRQSLMASQGLKRSNPNY